MTRTKRWRREHARDLRAGDAARRLRPDLDVFRLKGTVFDRCLSRARRLNVLKGEGYDTVVNRAGWETTGRTTLHGEHADIQVVDDVVLRTGELPRIPDEATLARAAKYGIPKWVTGDWTRERNLRVGPDYYRERTTRGMLRGKR